MERELVGVVTRHRGQVAIRDDDGKERLVQNLFDGLSGRRVRIKVEVVED